MASDGFADFEHVDAILRHALKLAPEARAAFIERECGSDMRLLARIRKLVSAAEAAGRFTPGGAWRGAHWPDGAGDKAPAAAGELFGTWRALEEIGRGGMAVVYRGERAGGDFEQQVAIKLLHASQAEFFEQRFRRERQILARLEHPNIGRLLDGGTTASGRSYLVMEYIEGDAIDRYCDRRNLSIQARLELFLKVCSAVQFAHRNLIVHRDLKPSNILVTAEGEPKLLDFGIAKLIEPDPDTGDLTRTALAERMLTPQYASPEQVLGEPVSTATDVYVLGLLLYELLTGQRARRFDTSSPREIEHIICDTEPPPPSVAVSTPRTSRRLKGDLDNIVLKALRREPGRRYVSVEQLADDLRAHLEGRPVRARPDSVGYRMSKFLTRHTAGVAAATGVVALIVALVAFYTNQLQDERDRARAEADKVEQVVEFLATLLEEADPDRAQGRDVTVRQVLDQAARNIDLELASQPELRATMQAMIGRIYGQLQLYDDAETQLVAALDNQSQILGADDPEVAATAERLALVHLGLGRWDEAERLARESLNLRRQSLGSRHPDLVGSLVALARVHYMRGQLDEGRTLVERALALVEDAEPEALADTLAVALRIELEAGEPATAEQLARREVELRRGFDPPRTRALAQALYALTGSLMLRGQPEHLKEAEVLLLETIDIERAMLGERHYYPAFLLAQLATIRARLGDFEGGERAHLEALDAVTAALGPNHPEVGSVLNNIAVFYHRQEQWREAIDYYSRALDLRIPALEENHPMVGTTRAYLGLALHMAGDERAESTYRTALAELIESRGADHEKVGNLRTDLGVLLAEAGRYEEAEPELRAGLAIAQPIFGDEDQRTDSARTGLGFTLCGLGRTDEGESFLNASREWREFRYPEDHWRRFELDLYEVECLIQRGRSDEARQRLDAALNGLAESKPEDHILFSLGPRLQDRIQGASAKE